MAGKNKEYADKYAEYAMEQMRRYGIPASVTLAQGILERLSLIHIYFPMWTKRLTGPFCNRMGMPWNEDIRRQTHGVCISASMISC